MVSIKNETEKGEKMGTKQKWDENERLLQEGRDLESEKHENLQQKKFVQKFLKERGMRTENVKSDENREV